MARPSPRGQLGVRSAVSVHSPAQVLVLQMVAAEPCEKTDEVSPVRGLQFVLVSVLWVNPVAGLC